MLMLSISKLFIVIKASSLLSIDGRGGTGGLNRGGGKLALNWRSYMQPDNATFGMI